MPVFNLDPMQAATASVHIAETPELKLANSNDIALRPSKQGANPADRVQLAFQPEKSGHFETKVEVATRWSGPHAPETFNVDGPSIQIRVGQFSQCDGPEEHIPKTEKLEGGTLIVCMEKQYSMVQRTISSSHGTVVAVVVMRPSYDSASGEIVLPDDVMKQRTLDAIALMESVQLSAN